MQKNSNPDTLSLLRAGSLKGSTRLDLSCHLQTFPPEIFELAETLEVLNLTGNALSALPHDLHRLKKLKVIFCSSNQFTHVPEVLGECSELTMIGFKANKIKTLPENALPKKLQWLILTDNQIAKIPSAISQCQDLQKLMLAGNQLTALPETMAACINLELLRISANRFVSIPQWLLDMPRLAWLALAGNPFCMQNENRKSATADLVNIDWADLKLHQQLGEGASGVIYQAIWNSDKNDDETKLTHTNNARIHTENSKAVAVKLFKGAVTSDGLPQSEMAACMATGLHPNLTVVEGKLTAHPDNTQGLIMSLIDPSFAVLANPPSLSSCTRDVYAPDTQFSIQQVLNITQGIASATQHLHAKGILHGDLYAHNILRNHEGDCLLSDFGGASFLPNDHDASQALQKIEVRAFACLLEELISRCNEGKAHSQLARLHQLQQACDHKNVASRPLFAEITQQLATIAAC